MLKYLCIVQTPEGLKAMVYDADNIERLVLQPENANIVAFEIQTDAPIFTMVDNSTWVPVPESVPE